MTSAFWKYIKVFPSLLTLKSSLIRQMFSEHLQIVYKQGFGLVMLLVEDWTRYVQLSIVVIPQERLTENTEHSFFSQWFKISPLIWLARTHRNRGAWSSKIQLLTYTTNSISWGTWPTRCTTFNTNSNPIRLDLLPEDFSEFYTYLGLSILRLEKFKIY